MIKIVIIIVMIIINSAASCSFRVDKHSSVTKKPLLVVGKN